MTSISAAFATGDDAAVAATILADHVTGSIESVDDPLGWMDRTPPKRSTSGGSRFVESATTVPMTRPESALIGFC